MKNLTLSIALAICIPASANFASAAGDAPKFDEVYQLLRSNLNNTSESDLNAAAVRGLLSQLSPNAMIVGDDSAATDATASRPIGTYKIYDDSYAYFRVQNVDNNLAADLRIDWQELAATNKTKIKGVVLDLRFAGGSDFSQAAAAANCFLDSTQPLLEFGGQVVRATNNSGAITTPLAVLINSKTSEAAEGLAAVLHETGTGLLLGSQTAGRASLFKDFPLSDGSKLRIAVGAIKLADGSVFSGGVKPDIAIEVNPLLERILWEHPYQTLAQAGTTNFITTTSATNQPAFHQYNEAELVREQRDGADLEAQFDGSEDQIDPDLKVLADPALARALDLLKGLAVIHKQ